MSPDITTLRHLGPSFLKEKHFSQTHLDVPGRKWMDQWLGSMGYYTYLSMGYSLGLQPTDPNH